MDRYQMVKKQIDRMDYLGLLSGGAPKDEFDTEAKAIAERITPEMSAREIAELIADVFNKSFNEDDRPERFMDAAEAIAKEFAE